MSASICGTQSVLDRSTGKLLLSVTDRSLLAELFKARGFEILPSSPTTDWQNLFLTNDEGQTIVFSFTGEGKLVLVWAKEGRERGRS